MINENAHKQTRDVDMYAIKRCIVGVTFDKWSDLCAHRYFAEYYACIEPEIDRRLAALFSTKPEDDHHD